MPDETLEHTIEERVAALGYEFVELEQMGSKGRPILRLRIDRPGAQPGEGVTLEDCTRVSRALEQYLDDEAVLGGRYVLEVSSPGIERPLLRRRDFERFTGEEIAVRARAPLAGRGRRLEGRLLGVVDEEGAEKIRLQLGDGAVVDIPRADIARAHLIFRWREG